MRLLKFEATKEGRLHWDICYGGLLVNPEGYSGSARRVASRVIDRFESIGKPVEDPVGIAKFELADEGGEIALEEAEYKLLLNTVDEKVHWARESIKWANDTVTWLEGISAGTPK